MHVHRLEKIWIWLGIITMAAFFVTIALNAFAMGATPPSDLKTIDPKKVDQTPPFDKPGLHQIGPNEYDADMTAFIFGFNPNSLEIPKGATVHFHVTSKDVVHGFEIPGTDVNMMVEPGFVNTVTHTFNTSGKFLILCNEYCGAGHQMMMGTIQVKDGESK